MKITKTTQSRLAEVDFDHLQFGEIFADHMLEMEYRDRGWQEGSILPYGPITIPPALSALHYGQAIFDGLKAFYSASGVVNVFRPQQHYARMVNSCRRLCIPEPDQETFMQALTALIKLDYNWVPRKRGCSLYIRPFIFASSEHIGLRVSPTYRFMIITSPVSTYYKEGLNPIRLITPGEFVRAAKGGLGAAKTPANYAASLLAGEVAQKKGFSQVLWLDASERRYVEEVGSMNIFFLIGEELITPPLDGTILPGVTRDSVIKLAQERGIKVVERRIAIDEVFAASRAGTLAEVFGSGTAAVITPVAEIQHEDHSIVITQRRVGPLCQSLYEEITGIQYGEQPDRFGWRYRVEA